MSVNYIAEIKAFYDRLELNPLPSPAIALWHALMSIANKTGWQQEFTVAVSILVLKSGVNAQAIKRARNRLVQDGFITWRSRGGNQSAIYHINSLVVQNDRKNVPQSPVVQNGIENVPQGEPQSVPQGEPQTEPQSVPINKHKQKETETNIPPMSPTEQFEEFWSVYPKKRNRFMAETEYCNVIMSGVRGEDLTDAAKKYAEHCRRERKPEQFIKNPENFLRDNTFVEYLKGGRNGRAAEKAGADERSLNEIMRECGVGKAFTGF